MEAKLKRPRELKRHRRKCATELLVFVVVVFVANLLLSVALCSAGAPHDEQRQQQNLTGPEYLLSVVKSLQLAPATGRNRSQPAGARFSSSPFSKQSRLGKALSSLVPF